MLLLIPFLNALAQPTNSVTNGPIPIHSNTIPSISGKTDSDRTPAVSVGPFMFNGQEAKKQESDNIWISFLKVIIWPAVVVFIICFFNQEIRRFFGKIKSVKAKEYGLEMTPDEGLSDQPKKPVTPTVPPLPTPQAGAGEIAFEKAKAAAKITPALEPMIANIRDSIQKSPFTLEQKMELGIAAIARVALTAEYWRIYHFIYGSQLQLLQILNTRPVPQAELDVFFENVKQHFPDAHKSSNPLTYSAFLVNNGLIAQEGGNYIITARGREFLLWCIENNLGFNKQY